MKSLKLAKTALKSNREMGGLLLSTTMEVPVAIINTITKSLNSAKDLFINIGSIIQLVLITAVGCYILPKLSAINDYIFSKPVANKSSMEAVETKDQKEVELINRYNETARDGQKELNEEGQNSLHKAVELKNFEAAKVIITGPHEDVADILVDVMRHPVLNGADLVVNSLKKLLSLIAPKLASMLPNRTINPGATAEEINHVDDNGKTFLHSAAENFETAADLKVIEKAIKRGGNVTKIDNEGNTPLILSLENAQTEVPATKIVKVLTVNGEKLAEAALPIVSDVNKAELVESVVEYAVQQNGYIFGRNNSGNLLTPLLVPAIKAKNLEVIKKLYEGGVDIQGKQAIKASKLIDSTSLNEENLQFETKLLQNINDKEIVEKIKDAVNVEMLKTLCSQREAALESPYNQNLIKIVAKQAISTYERNDYTLTKLNEFLQNPTVSTAKKVTAVAASLPNTPSLVNNAIVNATIPHTGKAADWLNKIFIAFDNAIKQGYASIAEFEAEAGIDYISANNIEYQSIAAGNNILGSTEE
jgi:hypothetical protein